MLIGDRARQQAVANQCGRCTLDAKVLRQFKIGVDRFQALSVRLCESDVQLLFRRFDTGVIVVAFFAIRR